MNPDDVHPRTHKSYRYMKTCDFMLFYCKLIILFAKENRQQKSKSWISKSGWKESLRITSVLFDETSIPGCYMKIVLLTWTKPMQFMICTIEMCWYRKAQKWRTSMRFQAALLWHWFYVWLLVVIHNRLARSSSFRTTNGGILFVASTTISQVVLIKPKKRMDEFFEWINEPTAPNGQLQYIFCDNNSGHSETEDDRSHLSAFNAALRKLPQNSTEKTQPLDSFVIAKFKNIWCRAWDKYRSYQTYQCFFCKKSGKLQHLDCHWYMRLAARCTETFNAMEDEYGIKLTRKAMMWSGQSVHMEGIWKVGQTTIICKIPLSNILEILWDRTNAPETVNSPRIMQ